MTRPTAAELEAIKGRAEAARGCYEDVYIDRRMLLFEVDRLTEDCGWFRFAGGLWLVAFFVMTLVAMWGLSR